MKGQDQAEVAMKKLKIASESTSVPGLPADVFVLIIEHLEVWDIVRCQMVSTAWFKAFSKPEFLRILLRKYLHVREARHLISNGLLAPLANGSDLRWRETFNKVACRYFHLTHGRPRTIQKYKTAIPSQMRLGHWFPVSAWVYHESQPGGRLAHLTPPDPYESHKLCLGERGYLFRNAFWSYEDGLLVFVPAQPVNVGHHTDQMLRESASATFVFVMLDLESRRGLQVPFDINGKVVRNLRLKERTLIIEWAEKDPYHALNNSEYVHRHFASCYDIKPQTNVDGEIAGRWTITFRSEWKLHFLGLPLNHQDRFFSAHTKDHYAVYFWQPNRSMYTGDEEQPIECLIIWEIAQPRRYLPSMDPGGKHKPGNVRGGPLIVFRFDYRSLQHYGIRQGSSPSLIKFLLDSAQHTITFRENVCIAGQGYFDPAERLWCARTTTILFRGEGPHLRREWDGNLPAYRGNCSMETSDVPEPDARFLSIMDVVDDKAPVRFSLAETVFTGRDAQNMAFVRIRALESMATLDESTTKQIAHIGKIAGDERFLIGQNDSHEIVVLRFD